jgi:hypothetical protein
MPTPLRHHAGSIAASYHANSHRGIMPTSLRHHADFIAASYADFIPFIFMLLIIEQSL